MEIIGPEVPIVDFWPHPITSDGRTFVRAEAGQTLAEIFDPILKTPYAYATVNGALHARSEWSGIEVGSDDVVMVRASVHDGGDGGGSNPIAVILSIAIVITTAVFAPQLLPAAIASSSLLLAGTTALIQIGGLLLVNALFPPRLPDRSRALTATGRPKAQYSITAGRNRLRQYEPLFLLLGTHRVFPDIASAAYTEFDKDSDQYLNQIYDYGLGSLVVGDQHIGETLLSNFDGTTTQQGVAHITLVKGNVDTIQGGELDWLTGGSDGGLDAITRTTAVKTTLLAFDIAAQHFAATDQGMLVGRVTKFLFRYRLSGTSAWTEHNVNVRTPGGAEARNATRRSFTYPVTAGQYDVSARLREGYAQTADVTRITLRAAVNFRALQDDTADFTGRNPIAVRAKASGQLYGTIEQLNAVASQIIPKWDGSNWIQAALTSNCGDVLYKYLRGWYIGTRLVAGMGLPDSRIDLPAIQGFSTHCDFNGLNINLVLEDARDHAAMLQLICQCGWATPDQSTGKWGVVWEDEGRPVTAIITPDSVTAGSVSVAYDHEGLADEVAGTFIDKTSDWQGVTIRRNVPGVTNPIRPVEINLEGITDGVQAAMEVNRTVAHQFYHPRVVTWEMEFDEGLAINRGDVVGAAHGLIGEGAGGRILAISANRLTLSVPNPPTAVGTVWIWDLNGNVVSVAYTVSGNSLTLAAALPDAPGTDDPTAYRYMCFANNAERVKLRVTGRAPSGPDKLKFVARDEVDLYYDHRTSDITWQPIPPASTLRHQVEGFTVTENELGVRILAWSIPSFPFMGFHLRYGTAGQAWEAMTDLHEGLLMDSPLEVMDKPGPGTWRFAIVLVTPDGRRGAPSYQTVTLGTPPRALSGFREVEVYKVVAAGAAPPARPAGGEYDFRTSVLTAPAGWVWNFPAYGRTQVVYASTSTADSANGNIWTPDANDWSGPVIVGDADDLNIVYARLSADPTRAPARSVGVPSGWNDRVADVPAGSDLIYASIGIRHRATGLYVWQLPLQVEGQDGVAFKELTAYRVQDIATVAPARPQADGSFDFDTSTYTPPNTWVKDFPAHRRNQVVFATAATANDANSRLWNAGVNDWFAPVIVIDEGDINLVYTRAANPPSTPADSAATPAGWYNRVSSVPAGAGLIYVSLGYRAKSTTVFDWGDPIQVEGQDGEGVEEIFAVTNLEVIPNNQRPNNNWGYNQPAASGGLTWYTDAPNTSAANPVLLRCRRTTIGFPSVSAAVSALWSAPSIIGRYGQDGIGKERIYALTGPGVDTIPANQRPNNAWGYNEPGTVNGLQWYDDALNVTPEFPTLWRSDRAAAGSPAVGDAVAGEWAIPTIEGSLISGTAVRGPGIFIVKINAAQETAIAALGATLTATYAALADEAVPDESKIGDFVSFVRATTGFASMWSWDGTAWGRAARFIAAEQISAINLSAFNIQVTNEDFTGTLTADHIDADVQNYDELFDNVNGLTVGGTDSTLRLNHDYRDYDAILVQVGINIGSPVVARRVGSALFRVSDITTGTYSATARHINWQYGPNSGNAVSLSFHGGAADGRSIKTRRWVGRDGRNPLGGLIFHIAGLKDPGTTAGGGTTTPTNQPPVANAGNDISIGTGSAVTLRGSASDPDGSLASTVWTQRAGTAVALSNSQSLNTSFVSPATAGTLVFRLTARDNLGAITVDDVTVTVSAATLTIPTISRQTLQVNVAFSVTLPEATGGSGVYTYRMLGLSKIPGLSFDAATRVLSGTASSVNAGAGLTMSANDGTQTATRPFDVRVQAAAVEPELDVEDKTLSVNEGSTVRMRVRLTALPSSNVVVTASETSSKISVSPAARTFNVNNWSVFQDFTVTAVQDADTDDETASIALASTGGSTDGAVVAVTVIDDDAPTTVLPDADAPTLGIDPVSGIDEDETVTLSADIGSGGVYDTIAYAWRVRSGGGSLSGSGSSVVYTPADVSRLTGVLVECTATVRGDGTTAADGTLDRVTDTEIFTVRVVEPEPPVVVLPDADAPTVKIASVGSVNEGDTQALTASVSGGTYDAPLSYAWSITRGPGSISGSGASVTYNAPASVTANKAVTVKCIVTARGRDVTAKSGTSDTGSDTEALTVRNVLPDASAPNVIIGSVGSVDEGDTQALSASVSGGVYDRLSYDWSVSFGPGSISGSGASVTYNAPDDVSEDKLVTVKCIVTARGIGTSAKSGTSDDDTDSEALTVKDVPIVLPDAEAPTVRIANVGTVNEGGTLDLEASVSGGTYDTLSYAWSVSAGPGSISGSGAAVTYNAPDDVSASTSVTVECIVTARGTGGTAKSGTSDDDTDTEGLTVTNVPVTTTVRARAGGDKEVDSEDSVRIGGRDVIRHSRGSTVIAWSRRSGRGGVDETDTAYTNFLAPYTIRDATTVMRKTVTNNGVTDTDDVTIEIVGAGDDAGGRSGPRGASDPPSMARHAVSPDLNIEGGASVREGETLDLRAAVSGGRYDELEYAWSILSGGGAIERDGENVVFTPPDVTEDTQVEISCIATAKGTGINAPKKTSDDVSAITTVDVIYIP